MLSRDMVLAPKVVTVEFSLSPVFTVLESMHLLTDAHELSGLAEWITTTAAKMPAELHRRNNIVFNVMHPLFVIEDGNTGSFDRFEDFIAYVQNHDAAELRSMLVRQWISWMEMNPDDWSPEGIPTAEALLNNVDAFIEFMDRVHHCSDEEMTAIWREGHTFLQDPARMQALIISHLREMYETYVRPEYERTLPMLHESVMAFQKMNYVDMTPLEAIRAVTGRDLSGKTEPMMDQVDRLIFVPSPHIGPYVAKCYVQKTMYVIFGARLPRGAAASSPDLSRAELLVRLNALADDTRLRILEMLTRTDEMYAQDIIERLGLSQPTVSRHLSQLSATGYITERRQEVAKVYSLNTDRVMDTLRAITSFLTRQ